jgi:hypothetical protein
VTFSARALLLVALAAADKNSDNDERKHQDQHRHQDAESHGISSPIVTISSQSLTGNTIGRPDWFLFHAAISEPN